MVRTARACVWTDEPWRPLRASPYLISHVCVAGCSSSAFNFDTGLSTPGLSSLVFNKEFNTVLTNVNF